LSVLGRITELARGAVQEYGIQFFDILPSLADQDSSGLWVTSTDPEGAHLDRARSLQRPGKNPNRPLVVVALQWKSGEMERRMADKTISTHRLASFWLLILVLIPIALLLLAEFCGRVIIWANYGVPGKTYGLWAYDEELGAIHAKNGYNSNSETNDYGFRNRENVFDPKPPTSHRVIAYGSSTTFCYNLPTDQAWPIELQTLLRQNHNPKDQVLNAGAIGWSISHEIRRAERDLPVLKPDYVILYTGGGEEDNAVFAKVEGKSIAEALARGESRVIATNFNQDMWLQRNSVLMRVYDKFVGAKLRFTSAPPLAPEVDPVVIKHFLIVLDQFIDLIRKNGARPIYITMAGLPWGERKMLVSREGARLARAKGVPVFDAQTIVDNWPGNKEELFLSGSAHHYTETGSARLAEFIFSNAFAQTSVKSQ